MCSHVTAFPHALKQIPVHNPPMPIYKPSHFLNQPQAAKPRMLHAGRRLSWWMQQRLAAGAAQHTRGSVSRLSSLSSSSLAPPSSSLVAVSEEVQAALHERGAVVALESTIISHGNQSLAVCACSVAMTPASQLSVLNCCCCVTRHALSTERRDSTGSGGHCAPSRSHTRHSCSHEWQGRANLSSTASCQQSTIVHMACMCCLVCVCVQLCVGLESDQLEQLGAAGAAARKCSRRDIALSLADGGLGATTVAGTMYVLPFVLSSVGNVCSSHPTLTFGLERSTLHRCVASMVPGIHVFVTGGIGGVHRGAEDSMGKERLQQPGYYCCCCCLGVVVHSCYLVWCCTTRRCVS